MWKRTKFDLDYGAEAHRWFDYWLKGIDNGIMNEPAIHYYVMGAPKKEAWRASNQWPLAEHRNQPLLLQRGKNGQCLPPSMTASCAPDPPGHKDAADAYTVDYTTTSGKYSAGMPSTGRATIPTCKPTTESFDLYHPAPGIGHGGDGISGGASLADDRCS